MKNMDSLQMVKEQLKFQSRRLQKVLQEKETLQNELKDFKFNHESEIFTLKETIDDKDKIIQEEQRKALEAQVAATSARSLRTSAVDTHVLAEDDDSLPLNPADLRRKLIILRDRTLLLREQIEEEKRINVQLNDENSQLHKDLKDLHRETNAAQELKAKIEGLRDQLNEARESSSFSGPAIKKLVQEKEQLLDKYEKMVFGDLFPDGKGALEQEIIQDLKTEVEDLESEKNAIHLELELMKEDNAQMESKVSLLEEREIQDDSEYRTNSESRAAVTSEFFGGLENFLVTYSDMITLLLVVFVLLYSISRVDDEKFAEALSSFQEKELRIEKVNVRLDSKELEMLKRVKELVKDNVDPESLVRSDVRTVMIRLKSSDLFAPGSATLIEGAEDLILNAIAAEMQDGVKQVLVDGHTDDVPLGDGSVYPSNWELSTARASGVARVILGKMNLPPERMVVTGYGQYRPYKPNNSDQNRSLNRRVEIKILKDKALETGQQESKKRGSSIAPEALKLS